jgi:GTP cyclohydrolase I
MNDVPERTHEATLYEDSFTRIQKRPISAEQISRFESYAAEILSALGLDLNTDATRATPRRFIQALIDATEGYDGDPKLVRVFETECRRGPDCQLSQVIEGPILFFALCEHHGLPFYGSPTSATYRTST